MGWIIEFLIEAFIEWKATRWVIKKYHQDKEDARKKCEAQSAKNSQD